MVAKKGAAKQITAQIKTEPLSRTQNYDEPTSQKPVFNLFRDFDEIETDSTRKLTRMETLEYGGGVPEKPTAEWARHARCQHLPPNPHLLRRPLRRSSGGHHGKFPHRRRRS